jgi:hypothetical protein
MKILVRIQIWEVENKCKLADYILWLPIHNLHYLKYDKLARVWKKVVIAKYELLPQH